MIKPYKLFINFFIFFNLIFCQYNLSIGQFDTDNKSIEVILENEEPIGGFQFTLTGLVLTNAYGGSAENAGFSVSTSDLGIVLGFSFSGATIPAGQEALTYLNFDSINYQYTEITNIVLSSPDGVTLSNTTSSGNIDHGIPFCDGSWDSNAEIDECGICNGSGPVFECGCNDIVEGECDCDGNILDECNVCGGNNSSCYFSLALDNFDINNQTVDIIISNPEPIAGFQFNITGLNLISANGGLAQENNFTTNVGNNVVLGFSFSGAIIPSSENELLTTLSFSEVTHSISEIEEIIFSDINATTIPNINALNPISHGEPNCAGDFYSYDDTNSYGCCFDETLDCLGECNGNAQIDDCGICNGDGYSCLDCFDLNEFNCTESLYCEWETENINCNNFTSSSQCNSMDGCNWVSGGGGGGGGYGSGEHDEHNEENENPSHRGYCDGGIIEIDAFCLDTPCSDFDETSCMLLTECQWLNSNTPVDCISLPQDYCNNANECSWISGSGTYGSNGYCSGETTWIENNSCTDSIIPGCMVEIATNYNPDANVDDESCIFPPLGSLNFQELDLWTGTLEVHLDCEYPVAEFLIDISGLNMTGCYGGTSENAGFDIQMDGNIITGVSTGEYIPENSGLLMVLTFDNIINENICYENSWITTSANIEYEAILGECLNVELGCTDVFSLDYQDSAEYDNGTCSYAGNIIEAGMFYFNPNELNIDIGESVQWNNVAGFHSINGITSTLTGNSYSNPEEFYFDGSNIGVIGSHIFNIPGIYEYDCDIGNHAEQGMIGTIIVGQGGCMEHTACNYDEQFDFQFGECDFAEENFNCDGECLLTIDNCGICGGSGSSGDVNGNNAVDIADITYIIEHIIGEVIFDENIICIGDVTMNGILNITDIILIIEYILEN